MALTVETDLTTAWTQVISAGTGYVLQNNSNYPVILFWKATEPSATDYGFVLKPMHGINSGTFLQGDVWAKCPNGTGRVTVNQ